MKEAIIWTTIFSIIWWTGALMNHIKIPSEDFGVCYGFWMALATMMFLIILGCKKGWFHNA